MAPNMASGDDVVVYSTKKRRKKTLPGISVAPAKSKAGPSKRQSLDPVMIQERRTVAHQRLSEISVGKNLPTKFRSPGALSKQMHSKAQVGMEKRHMTSLAKDRSKPTRTLNALAKKRKTLKEKKDDNNDTTESKNLSRDHSSLKPVKQQKSVDKIAGLSSLKQHGVDKYTGVEKTERVEKLNIKSAMEILKPPVPQPKTPDVQAPKFARRPSVELNQLLPPFYGMNLGRRTSLDAEGLQDKFDIPLPDIQERTTTPPKTDSNSPPPKQLTTWERMRLPAIPDDEDEKVPTREIARSERRKSMVEGLKFMNNNFASKKSSKVIRLKQVPVHDVQGNLQGCSKAIHVRNSRRLSLDELATEPPENPVGDERFQKLFGLLNPVPEHETRNFAAITHGVIHAKRIFRGFIKKPREASIGEHGVH